jgi:hypothetical protein
VALARKLLVALRKYVTTGVVNGYMVIVLFDATATARDGVALYQHVHVVLSDEGREGREPIALLRHQGFRRILDPRVAESLSRLIVYDWYLAGFGPRRLKDCRSILRSVRLPPIFTEESFGCRYRARGAS